MRRRVTRRGMVLTSTRGMYIFESYFDRRRSSTMVSTMGFDSVATKHRHRYKMTKGLLGNYVDLDTSDVVIRHH